MNIDSNNFQQKEPTKCKTCKLFYGSEDFNGLCSSCHKKTEKTKLITEAKTTQQVKVEPIKETILDKFAKEQQRQQKQQNQQKQIDRKRCFACKKKVGMMGNQCRCGFVFCNGHRLPEQHSCNFDFHQNGKKKLEKQLQKVYNGKLSQI